MKMKKEVRVDKPSIQESSNPDCYHYISDRIPLKNVYASTCTNNNDEQRKPHIVDSIYISISCYGPYSTHTGRPRIFISNYKKPEDMDDNSFGFYIYYNKATYAPYGGTTICKAFAEELNNILEDYWDDITNILSEVLMYKVNADKPDYTKLKCNENRMYIYDK